MLKHREFYQNEHGHGDDQLVLREVVLLHLEHQLLGLALSYNTNFPETDLKIKWKYI